MHTLFDTEIGNKFYYYYYYYSNQASRKERIKKELNLSFIYKIAEVHNNCQDNIR